MFTTKTDLNILHDEWLDALSKMVEKSQDMETVSTAQGIAMELYQIEIIKPEEYHLISRYLKRLLNGGSGGSFPSFSPMKSLRPRTVSEEEIETIKRVVPQEIKRDLTRCFRKEDIPFVNGLRGRTNTLLELGLIDDAEYNMLTNSFNEKVASF